MTESITHIDWLGWIVFAIVVGSVLVVVLAAMFDGFRNRRKLKVPVLFIASLVILLVSVVVGIAVGGTVFSILMG